MENQLICNHCGSEKLVGYGVYHVNEGTFAFAETKITCTACGRVVSLSLKDGTITNSIKDIWWEKYQDDDKMLNLLAGTARKT